MKKVLLSLLLIASAGYYSNAQSGGTRPAPLVQDVNVTLAGINGQSIQVGQIKDNPLVQTVQGKEVTAFEFAWVKMPATGSPIYTGPYHNAGNKLSNTILSDFTKDAAGGLVTRIYIDGVYLKNSDGSTTKTKWGASYAVKP
jgi:hypothetical protein